MATPNKHITVCICTYQRPDLLRSLLADVSKQETDDRFTYSILVIDNDRRRSAETPVGEFRDGHAIRIDYDVEPEQNIALARNRGIERAVGDYICFIDDDESPTQRWLLTLFDTCEKNDVDGVLGPVHPVYAVPPPEWVISGKFYDRRSYPTGFVIDWRKGRTGNTLLKREVVASVTPAFRPEFRTGEDQDFFRRVIGKGYVFIWCDEAVAYEVVPPIRWKRSFLLRRALLRGHTSLAHPTFGALDILKSLIATPAYVLALPLAWALGQGQFMRILVSLCDHLGRLLGLIGINPIKEPYVTS